MEATLHYNKEAFRDPRASSCPHLASREKNHSGVVRPFTMATVAFSGLPGELAWKSAKGDLSVLLGFSNSLFLQEQRPQEAPRSSSAQGAGWKPAGPGDNAFIFKTGICEADLYFPPYTGRLKSQPWRPRQRTGQNSGITRSPSVDKGLN